MKKILLLALLLFCEVQCFAQNSLRVTQISKNGPPIFFLPHIGCSSEMWQDIAMHYSKSHTCYLVDFAGFDGLKPITAPYSQSYVNDLILYIKSNRLENIILVGQNYGAYVAVKLAQNKDLKIKSIVASDFYPKLSMVLDTAMTPGKMESIKKSIRKGIVEPDSTAFAAYQKQTAEMMNFRDSVNVDRFVNWQVRSERETLAGTLCEQMEDDLLPALDQNKIPMLVFSTWYFAKKYKQMPLSEADKHIGKMYRSNAHVKHAITETAKDFIANDEPQWFINEMDNFLKRPDLGK